jgi:hypothetical protein
MSPNDGLVFAAIAFVLIMAIVEVFAGIVIVIAKILGIE